MGGKDAASARYIFTALSPVTRHLFPAEDDAVLTFLEEEGQSIEPTHYLPIIPLCLVNGSDGIGTGWSSSIPCYNPRELIKNLRKLMRGEQPEPMEPWYKGWTGTLEPDQEAGRRRWDQAVPHELEEDDDGAAVLRITDLPIGKWTRDYKTFLEGELVTKAGVVDDVREYHAENRVHFSLALTEKGAGLSQAAIAKTFKL